MDNSRPFQFGISSMLLITTLLAVIMSISVTVPGIGIFLAIVTVPALLRTYMLVRRKRDEGQTVTSADKTALFVLSLCIGTLIVIATGAAFFVTCFAGAFAASTVSGGGLGSVDIVVTVGVVAGAVVALPLFIYLLVISFRRKDKKPNSYSASTEALQVFIEDFRDEPENIPAPPPASPPSPPAAPLPEDTP